MAGEAGAPARLAAMIVHHRHAEMQLDIGHLELGTGFEETAAFGDVRGHRSAPLAPVLCDPLEDSRDAGKRQAGEIRRVRGKGENKVRMILQVLSDTGQMVRGCDAVLRQRGAVADAGKHQELRALKRAGGKDHFAADANLPDILALAVLDTDRSLALEQDAGGLRLGLDAQIRARCHEWVDVAACRAPAFAVLLGDLVGAEAFLLLGVEVLADAELRLARGQGGTLGRICRWMCRATTSGRGRISISAFAISKVSLSSMSMPVIFGATIGTVRSPMNFLSQRTQPS